MIPIRFGLALGTALLLAPFGAQAQDLSASISSDGSELAEAGEALGLGGTESRSFAGSGETGVFGGASAVNETAADFSALLAIAPATAPVGSSPTMAPTRLAATAIFSDAKKNGMEAGRRSFQNTCPWLAL